jgi:hypothetical protein
MSKWKITPPTSARPHGGGHPQRRLGQRRLVLLAHGESRQLPRGEIQPGGQVQPALVGGNLGQVAVPALIDRLGAEAPVTRSGIGAAAMSGRVRQRRLRYGQRPCGPWWAIEAAAVFVDTRQPAATRSAHTRRDP